MEQFLAITQSRYDYVNIRVFDRKELQEYLDDIKTDIREDDIRFIKNDEVCNIRTDDGSIDVSRCIPWRDRDYVILITKLDVVIPKPKTTVVEYDF